jgi:acetaldehyde dehydrogenase / alcohol dehydrogenase
MVKTAVREPSISKVVDIEGIMEKAAFAAAIFSQLTQEHTDRIVRAVCEAGFKNRIRLAKLAYEETGIGVWQDKVIKNVVATQYVYENIKDLKTVGIISDDKESGITEIAQPIGPVFALIPVTNPTSTTMFKILIALKTRNPIIISSHHKAMKCSIETARVCYEAALEQDAPQDCIQWLEAKSSEDTRALMRHKKLSLVLATGGSSLVGAAYSSGTPALGVGPGNVPAYIEKSADIGFAVEQIFISKTFDNGTICASEQAIIVEKSISNQAIEEIKKRKGHFLSFEEVELLEQAVFDKERGLMNADIVGKPASFIAKLAGINAPEGTRLLIAPLKGVGKEHPISSEILAPVIAFYIADNFEHAVKLCIDLNYHGGIGHTVSIFSNDDNKIKEFAFLMNAGRILVNMPSSQGAVGGIYNTLPPSFTLGCGSGGKNITTDNITARHLLNIQRIARRRVNRRLADFDNSVYFDEKAGIQDVEKIFNRNY